MMTQLMGCRHGDVFAAIAPVMGSLEKVNADGCGASVPLSVLLIHGTEDPIVPYEGGLQDGPRSPYYLSAEKNAKHWAEYGGCSGDPETTVIPPVEGQYGELLLTSYTRCEPGIEIALCTVTGGGHTWPGSTGNYDESLVGPTSYALNASEYIWAFFKAHPRVKIEE
jgi:polyhydroxybutyrate depolymerase